jgi:hypothetical protein
MKRTIGKILAALVTLGASGATAQDQDRDRTQTRDPATHTTAEPDQLRTQDRDRIRDTLRTDGQLSTDELAAMDPELDRYLQRNGDAKRLQETVRTAAREGCTGACSGDVVREMNRVMARGYSDEDAASVVGAAVREQRRAGPEPVAGAGAQGTGAGGAGAVERERLRAHVDDELQLRERERDRERDGDGQGPEREREHQPGSPTGAGEHGRGH